MVWTVILSSMYRHEGNDALSSDHGVCVTANNEWGAARKTRWIAWLIMHIGSMGAEHRDKLYTCTILWYSFYCLSLSEQVTETNTSIQIPLPQLRNTPRSLLFCSISSLSYSFLPIWTNSSLSCQPRVSSFVTHFHPSFRVLHSSWSSFYFQLSLIPPSWQEIPLKICWSTGAASTGLNIWGSWRKISQFRFKVRL